MYTKVSIVIVRGVATGGTDIAFAGRSRTDVMNQLIDWTICHSDELVRAAGGEPNEAGKCAREFVDIEDTREHVGVEEAYWQALGLIAFAVSEPAIEAEAILPSEAKKGAIRGQ